MSQPHAFKPIQYDRQHCDVCRMASWHTNHIGTLNGMESSDADRESARQLTQAEELTAELRRPLRDISAKAGRMEREAPLFHGPGDNPTLF